MCLEKPSLNLSVTIFLQVLMLDYGFKEFVSTSKLRTIVKQFRDPRCFSFCCHLADVTPAGGNKNWSRTASEFMEEQIKSNKLFIKRKVGRGTQSCI